MERDFPRDAAEGVDAPARSYTGGIYLTALDSLGSYGMSLFLGTSVGFDVTAKLFKRNYLTLGYTLGDIFQGYLQHRAFNSNEVAASVGIGGRREYLTYQVPCENILGCGPEKLVYSIGIRGFGLIRDHNTTRLGMKTSVYAGYIPYVRRPVVSIAISLGGF